MIPLGLATMAAGAWLWGDVRMVVLWFSGLWMLVTGLTRQP